MPSATLDATPTLAVQLDLFPSDQYRRPPEMPVFRDEPPMPKKPDPPKIHEPEKPLPFYHWSKHQALIDARLMRALADEGRLSEKKIRQIKGEGKS